MPFREHVYYPLDAAMAAPAPAVPTFGFRARQGSPDWRRLSAVDVERVERERDVALLQEHLAHITFCSAERERCPHCHGPTDPLLLKLLRLVQLATEYLLHCQDGLAAQLHTLEQALEAARAERDQLGEEAARHGREAQRLQEECRRRKRMISALQRMLEAGASCHQCRFCEKAFMNYSFLQSHMQRRHPEESHTAEQKKKAQTDKLQDEINKLKEQLQLTKSELEAEQHANMVRFSKECEQQKSKEEEILQAFYKWKEEEKEKLANEIEKVKKMFMQEFKELASRNTSLEHLLELQQSDMQLKSNLGTLKDSQEFTEEKSQNTQDYQNMMRLLEKQESKWTSRVQTLHQEHEKEKGQLLLQLEKLKSSMTEDLNKSNTFYKKRIEELGQRLQEQNELILTQKKQIRELSTKSVANIKPYDVNSLAHQVVEPKSSLPGMHEQTVLIHMLEPIEELSEEEKEIEKGDHKVGRSNQHLISALKTHPSLTKELRAVLEQALEEKLESLGIKMGVRGIPSDHLNRILLAIESAREEKEKQMPDMQLIRENLERQISFRIEERSSSSCSRLVSIPHRSSEDKQRLIQLGTTLSTSLEKPVKWTSKTVHPAGQKMSVAENTSTPKPRKHVLRDGVSRRTSSIATPPFSSEDEVDDDDIKQSYISPELLQTKPSSSSVNNCGMTTNKSAIDWTEDSEKEEEEIETPFKPSKGAIIQKLTEQVEKTLSNHGNKNKPPGGLNVAEAFVKKDDIQELKFTEVDDDDWDISSVEEESLLAKDERGQKGTAIQKNNGPSTISMVQAWGAPKANMTKEEGLHDADTTSTLKSSLVTVTDWSNSSDL
ncbi:PREDICTED: zinc finger protein DZIP1 isoform X3 [Gavialis gangeticus]|uniref:zinc finger protein DZIP1 isoform X3 n=1 Tax=Gavialis gangeticus TaxID=94835 RepID=UPI00092F258E|nr:PREDICTED: zinc finger protein DZIP1 isoform X3 [Gavialis gangeticus]